MHKDKSEELCANVPANSIFVLLRSSNDIITNILLDKLHFTFEICLN